jgi:signal transduction histidine kinase
MDVREGAMKPLWLNGNLVLARRVILNGKTYIQGCWLNWENIKKSLIEDIRDLLPEADLVPVLVENTDRTEYRLAALPVKLKPGPMPGESSVAWSPIQISLLIAWVCVLLGAAAVAALLLGAVTLSERRGAFVSAVTHELRTPLTTFRMYTEMLQGGMVKDEDKKNRYLNTLRVEAERLSHLVENVLAYAKLERGVKGKRLEPVTLRDLIGRTKQRLSDRAEQAGMRILVEGSPQDFEALAKTDPSAVEQILFNLVDNACKYAANADDKVIRVSAERGQGRAALRVSDSGPGFSVRERKRLFRPFSKSASEAAHSAPGVGLGLALSRRLARDMGGDLNLDSNVKSGASFILTMPPGSAPEAQPGGAQSSPSPTA